jgi:hypothetical protein
MTTSRTKNALERSQHSIHNRTVLKGCLYFYAHDDLLIFTSWFALSIEAKNGTPLGISVLFVSNSKGSAALK